MGLTVLYLNARSVKAFIASDGNPLCKICRLTILQQLVFCCWHDVAPICETWLKDKVLPSELLPGYNIYHKDRSRRVRGRVLIAVKHDIQSNHCFDLGKNQIEMVTVELLKISCKPVILYTFYHAAPALDDLNLLNISCRGRWLSSVSRGAMVGFLG